MSHDLFFRQRRDLRAIKPRRVRKKKAILAAAPAPTENALTLDGLTFTLTYQLGAVPTNFIYVPTTEVWGANPTVTAAGNVNWTGNAIVTAGVY